MLRKILKWHTTGRNDRSKEKQLKCMDMTREIIFVYFKGLSKYGRMVFFFLKYILTFFYYANKSSDGVILFATKIW